MLRLLRLFISSVLVMLVVGATTACMTSAPAQDLQLAAPTPSISAVPPLASSTASPTPVLSSTPVSTVPPTPVLPPTFTVYQTPFFRLGLPPGWEARDVAMMNTDVVVSRLNRTLPPLTRLVSTTVALPTTYGWAVNTVRQPSGFAETVIIQALPLVPRHPLRLRTLPVAIYELYHQSGVTVTRIEAGIVINQHEAAKLRSTIPLTLTADTSIETETYHYFVGSERTLWILTYIIDTRQFGRLNPLIL